MADPRATPCCSSKKGISFGFFSAVLGSQISCPLFLGGTFYRFDCLKELCSTPCFLSTIKKTLEPICIFFKIEYGECCVGFFDIDAFSF